MKSVLLAPLLPALTSASLLWDGRFNDLISSTDLEAWSWSNQIEPYQYYIHGSSSITSYANLSPSYANPSDTGSNQGVKITLDSTAYWNGQTMRRTELIPQTSAPINEGKVFYHFSIMRKDENRPATTKEHQIAFFESHFTELKAGWLSGASGTEDTNLRWCVSGNCEYWTAEWEADVWHNMAYEIDFDAGTVGLWHSTGGDDLVLTVSPVSASTSSNGQDWHLGVLELPRDGYADEDEDMYFSGVYVEDGEITVSVSGPGSDGGDGGDTTTTTTSTATTSEESTSTPTTMTTLTTSSTTTSTTTSAEPTETCTVSKWAQCDGIGYSGCTTCVAGSTCEYLNDWYSQCL